MPMSLFRSDPGFQMSNEIVLLLVAFGVNFVKGAGLVLMIDEHTLPQSTGLVQAEYVSFNQASAWFCLVPDMWWWRGFRIGEYI